MALAVPSIHDAAQLADLEGIAKSVHRVFLLDWPPRAGKNRAIARFIKGHPELRFIIVAPSIGNFRNPRSGALSTMARYLTDQGVTWHPALGRAKACRIWHQECRQETPSGSEHRAFYARYCGKDEQGNPLCPTEQDPHSLDSRVAAREGLGTANTPFPLRLTFKLNVCPVQAGRALLRNPPPGEPVLTTPTTLRQATKELGKPGSPGWTAWATDLCIVVDEAHKETLFTTEHESKFVVAWDGAATVPRVLPKVSLDPHDPIDSVPAEVATWAETPERRLLLHHISEITQALFQLGATIHSEIASCYEEDAPLSLLERWRLPENQLPNAVVTLRDRLRKNLFSREDEVPESHSRSLAQLLHEIENSLRNNVPHPRHTEFRAFVENQLVRTLRLAIANDESGPKVDEGQLDLKLLGELLRQLERAPTTARYREILSKSRYANLSVVSAPHLAIAQMHSTEGEASGRNLLSSLQAILDRSSGPHVRMWAAAVEVFVEAPGNIVLPTLVRKEKGRTYELTLHVMVGEWNSKSETQPVVLAYRPLVRAVTEGARIVLLSGTPLPEDQIRSRLRIPHIQKIALPANARVPTLTIAIEDRFRSKKGRRDSTMTGKALNPEFAGDVLEPIIRKAGPGAVEIVCQSEDQYDAMKSALENGRLRKFRSRGLSKSRLHYARDATSLAVAWETSQVTDDFEQGTVIFVNPPRPPLGFYSALIGFGSFDPDRPSDLGAVSLAENQRQCIQEVVQTGLRVANETRDGRAILLGGRGLIEGFAKFRSESPLPMKLRAVDVRQFGTSNVRAEALVRASQGKDQDPLNERILQALSDGPKNLEELEGVIIASPGQLRSRLQTLEERGKVQKVATVGQGGANRWTLSNAF